MTGRLQDVSKVTRPIVAYLNGNQANLLFIIVASIMLGCQAPTEYIYIDVTATPSPTLTKSIPTTSSELDQVIHKAVTEKSIGTVSVCVTVENGESCEEGWEEQMEREYLLNEVGAEMARRLVDSHKDQESLVDLCTEAVTKETFRPLYWELQSAWDKEDARYLAQQISNNLWNLCQ